MRNKIFFIIPVFFGLFTSCTLEEARAPKHTSVVVYTDVYCPDDSVFISEFENYAHMDVRIFYKKTGEIMQLIASNRYNAGADILITQSDSLRRYLRERNLLHRIQNKRLFRNLSRQFNNTHYLWLPLCHDPLVLATRKDSTDDCAQLNWNKILRDSSGTDFHVATNELAYYRQEFLRPGSKFTRILDNPDNHRAKNALWKLTDLVQKNESDPKFNQAYCFHYLAENQRFFSSMCSVSIYKYGRNKSAAIRFLDYYGKFNYQIASNRNQLSTSKGITVDYRISELGIR